MGDGRRVVDDGLDAPQVRSGSMEARSKLWRTFCVAWGQGRGGRVSVLEGLRTPLQPACRTVHWTQTKVRPQSGFPVGHQVPRYLAVLRTWGIQSTGTWYFQSQRDRPGWSVCCTRKSAAAPEHTVSTHAIDPKFLGLI